MRRVIGAIDRLGELAGWLGRIAIIVLLALMLYEVIARYAFDSPTIWGSDLATMASAAIFLLGAAVTLREGGHIRIDFLAARWSLPAQNLINAAVLLALFFPCIFLLASVAWQDALDALRTGEIDLAMAWKVPIWPFRALIASALTVLLLQTLAEGARHLLAAAAGTRPRSLGPAADD
jgi:TRAP-type mannitol/chloroaromatic compound transport system permease small subunit